MPEEVAVVQRGADFWRKDEHYAQRRDNRTADLLTGKYGILQMGFVCELDLGRTLNAEDSTGHPKSVNRIPPGTLEEIGERFGLTRERVRQIKEKAIQRLRHNSRSRPLKSYLF